VEDEVSSSEDEDDMVTSKPRVKRAKTHNHEVNRVMHDPCFDCTDTSVCDGDTELRAHLL
jgi:hypothetical protein